MRLDKFISSSTDYGRKDIKHLVKIGKVEVNGKIIKDSGYQVNENDSILLNSTPIIYKKYLYYIMDKPDEVVSAMTDTRLPSIGDFLSDELKAKKLSPVGRLDYHTTGLIIITNDGELSHRITSPKYHLNKTYEIVYSGNKLTSDNINEASNGMVLKDTDTDIKLLPAKLILGDDIRIENQTFHTCTLILTEGKTHQVRRMISAWNCEVIKLRRTSIGNIKLDDSVCLDLTSVDSFSNIMDDKKHSDKSNRSLLREMTADEISRLKGLLNLD